MESEKSISIAKNLLALPNGSSSWLPTTAKEWAWLLLIIGLVVGLGLVAVNQYMAFKYKVYLLGSPCQLCVKLNPDWEQCYKQTTTPRANTNANIEINISELDKLIIYP